MSTSDIVQVLVQHWFGLQSGELHIGGIPVGLLAAQYGTPLFVYDRSVLDRRLDSLRAALPQQFNVCYSVKANPNLAIISHFLTRGCGLEIASAGELAQAQAAGCRAEQILFAGPGKTDVELELAITSGIGEIHLESLNEAKRIAGICERLVKRARVAVRVNPSGDAQGGAMRMGGKSAPFGIDEEQLPQVLGYLLSKPCLDFSGIHLFVGTQVLDAAVLLNQYEKGLQIARGVVSRSGKPLRTVDFGGGLGIPYFAGDRELDLNELRLGLIALMNGVRDDSAFTGTRFVLEPGRFLVGESGIYVTRIVDIKESRGKRFLILDGGMNHHLAASGNLGQTIKRNYPVGLLQKIGRPAAETVDVVGPLCTPLDTLGRAVALPAAEVGDLVGVFQSGAYARTASPLGFLSHCTPPEVLVSDGQHALIRSRGEAGDFIRDVHMPFLSTPTPASVMPAQ